MRSSLIILTLLCITATVNSAWNRSGTQHWRSDDVLESVVQIQKRDTGQDKWITHGTGVAIDIDSTKPFFCVITNRHLIISNDAPRKDSIRLIFHIYSTSDSVTVFREQPVRLLLDSSFVSWSNKPGADYAIVRIERFPDSVNYEPIKYSQVIPFDSLDYGDDIEFLGFPEYSQFGLLEGNFDLPILRKGAIAYFAINDYSYGKEIYMTEGMFLVDGVSFGGNSGGPVFRVRKAFRKSGNEIILYDEKRLAGIIACHLPVMNELTIPFSTVPFTAALPVPIDSGYDTLSYKLSLPDVTVPYKENSNLAIVVSMDLIKKLYDQNMGKEK